jgi:DNA-binding NarL/FixJ family response regulator
MALGVVARRRAPFVAAAPVFAALNAMEQLGPQANTSLMGPYLSAFIVTSSFGANLGGRRLAVGVCWLVPSSPRSPSTTRRATRGSTWCGAGSSTVARSMPERGYPLSALAEETPDMTVRILIADDQALVRAGFKMILDAEDDLDVVGEASDGAQAVTMANDLEPDVVLMDIRMPELDGIEATRRIIAAAGERPVRVLMLTTFDLNEYVYEALRAGASGFLLKDVPPEQLVAGIRVVAEGEALLAPSITRRLIQEFASAAPTLAEPPRGLDELTARELEVFKLLARGLSNAEIAEELVVSETTVKTHVARVLMKLGLRDRVQAVVLAYETGLVQRDA